MIGKESDIVVARVITSISGAKRISHDPAAVKNIREQNNTVAAGTVPLGRCISITEH